MPQEQPVKRPRKVSAIDHEMSNANSENSGSTSATNDNMAATENRGPINGTAGGGSQTRTASGGMKLNATVVPTPLIPTQTATLSGMEEYDELENQEELMCEGFVFLPVDATLEQTQRFLSDQALSNSSANNYTASYMTGKLLP